MSTTHTALPYRRFTRQVNTAAAPLSYTAGMAAAAAAALQAAPWVEQSTPASSMPVHTALIDAGAPTFDAYKFCGDYETGVQRAYAGMVAYRFRIPQDALTSGSVADVVSVAVDLYTDRWCVDGARMAAYLSPSPVPSDAWSTLREGSIYTADLLPAPGDPDADPPTNTDSSATITLTLPGSTAAAGYLYVVLSLEDYATTRGNWIEGSAALDGSSVSVVFSRSVAPDVATLDRILAYTALSGGLAVITSRWTNLGAKYAVSGGSANRWLAYTNAVEGFGTADMSTATVSDKVYVRIDPVDSGVNWQVDASGWTANRYLCAHRPMQLSRMSFSNTIPGATGAIAMFLVVYLIEGYQPLLISDAQSADPRFWSGELSSIELAATPDPTDHAAQVVYAGKLPSLGFSVSASLPIDLALTTGAYTLVCAACVSGIIDADAMSTTGVQYGITWSPDQIILA